MASMSVSGIVSGMDWESMIDEIITNAAKPAQVKVNKKTNLTNKKSLFEEMKVTMNTLQSSLSALKLPSTYKAKTIDIERLDKNTSYKGVLTATANADASVNVWEVKVNKLATAQINRSKQITDSNLTSTLNGVSGKTIYIDAGGQKVGVEVKSSDTLESLKSRINTALTELDSPLYITASVVDNKLILKSDYTGKGTMTSKETVNYNYSTGINRLSNISIPSSAVDNVKITASGKSYVIHKDFEIANGNEIRWRQYDRGDEVALGDTVAVKYTMAAGDVYEAPGTYNGTEAEISGFSYVNDVTLADRLKIVEKNDSSKTYKYGTDFTITDNKVVWLDAQDATTNEPSSYTVSYNKDVTLTSSISGKKVNPTTTLASECTVHIPMSATVTFNNSNLQVADTTTPLTYSDIENVSNALSLSDVIPSAASLYTTDKYVYYINGNEDNVTFKLTDENDVEYTYGKDFVLMSEVGSSSDFSKNGTLRTARTTDNSSQYVSNYKSEYRITGTSTPIPDGSYTLDVSFDKTLTASEASSCDFKTIADNLDAAGLKDFTITVNGTTYKYGESFTVNNDGTVTLTDASTDDDISASDWADFEAKYREVSGLSDDDALPLLTLTDADEVLRTYFDPEDSSLFTMKDTTTGKEYEYGRDYVIRVNDSGDGYVFAWAIPGDKDNDGKITIKDADTAVTTYTQKKNISTLRIKAAPDVDDEYAFNYTGTITKSDSKTVSSSDTNNIATLFSDSSIDSSDITITSGSTTYTYGSDYVIDKTGTITWLNQNSTTPAAYTANYTFSSNESVSMSVPTLNSNGIMTVSASGGAIAINNLGTKTFTDSRYTYVDEAEGKAAFTLTDGDGNTYEYGKDFAVRYSTSGAGTKNLTIVRAKEGYNWPSSLTNRDSSTSMPKAGLTLTYNKSVSRTVISSETVEDALGFIPSDYSKLSITDIDGNPYTENTDYTINTSTGAVTFISTAVAPKHPTGAYTLKYTASGGESLTTDGVTRSATDSITGTPLASVFDDGTTTITYGSKTYYEGVDFNIDEDDDGYAKVTWINDNDGGYEWFYPNPGSTYTINHTDDDGNTTTYSGYRTSLDTLDMKNTLGMSTANGSISVTYGDSDTGYQLDSDGDLGNGHDIIQSNYSIDVTKTTDTTTGETTFNFRWLTPTQTTHSNLPSMNEELTVEFGYDANTFDLSDDGDGDLLQALGFINSSGSYIDYTAADDAELEIDGQTVTVDSNDIGADYENEVIKGVTLHLKGTGTVSLDISHDAEKAVESIQTFVDSYNDLMTWINTRMSEKQVDEDTAATIDSDDFRMRWGLLHGNSLLRNTKSQMRSLVSQNFTFSFTERKSSSEVYGRMSYNGLKSSSTLRLRIGSKYVDVTIDPDDTLETIVAKINDDTKNGPMHNIYYDDDGNKLQTPLLKASVQNDKLVINSTSSDEITMSGSAAMNALKMNYTYKGLYQIGIETTSDDYGKSGELVFDSDEFMTALEDNPDEVQSLMLAFANQFNTWTRSMLNSSSSGEVSGTLTREIENIQTQIDSINEYLESYQDRLDRMEESLRTRYGNTETQFSKLSQQANSIAAILNQLNGNASGGGYGQTSS